MDFVFFETLYLIRYGFKPHHGIMALPEMQFIAGYTSW